MLKKCFILASLFLLTIGIGFIASCTVGLGDSVDIEAPKISISYPPAASTVRGAFMLAGDCSDDKGMKSVVVTVAVDGEETERSYTADLLNGNANWSVKLNEPVEGAYPFKDGKYTFSAKAVDTSGRTSVVTQRTLEIDNTAPVFVISAPGTLSISKPTSYGSIFKITGQIAEEHTVSSMILNIYDENKKLLTSSPWVENGVTTAGGTSVTFASYDEKKADTEMSTMYASIYDVAAGGTQNFYCSVTLKDSAGLWQTPWDEKGNANTTSDDADDIGNTTSGLWLNDSIYGVDAGANDLLSKNATPQYSVSDLMTCLNGTYVDSRAEGDAETVVSVLERTKTDTKTEYLAFSLNKDANPTYEILGFPFTGGEIKNKASKSSSVTFKATFGRNETYFKPSTIKVYMFGPYTEAAITEELLTSIYGDVAGYAKNNPALSLLAWDGSVSGADSSTSSCTESITLPDDVAANSYYVFGATGNDQDGIDFIANNGYRYGFVGVTSGIAPTVTITKPSVAELANAYGSAASLLSEVNATVESSESAIASARYEITVTDIETSAKLGTITGDASLVSSSGVIGESKKLEFSFNAADSAKSVWTAENGVSVDPRIIAENSGNLYRYSVLVYGYDVGGAEGKSSAVATLDTKKPVVEITNVSPVAETETDDEGATKYRINGIVKIEAKISDANLSKVYLDVSDENGTTRSPSTGDSTFVSVSVDTRDFADGSNLTISVKAVDSAGNEATVTSTEYIADQTTDIPKVTFMGVLTDPELAESENISDGRNLFLTTDKIMASISDDDAVDSVLINYRKDGSGDYLALLSKEDINKSSYNLSQALTSGGSYLAEGAYEFVITVKDKKTDGTAVATKTIGPFWIGIDEGNPKINFGATSQSGAYTSAGTTKTISGTVQDSSGMVTIQRYPTKTDALNGTNPELASPIVKDDTSSDTKTVSTDDGTSWQDSLVIPVGATEGRTVYYVATDKYGRTETYSWRYKIDGTAPTAWSDWTDANDMTTWTNSASKTYRICLSDSWNISGNAEYGDASGIGDVVLTVKDSENNSTDYTMKLKEVAGSSDRDSHYFYYEYTVPFTADGEYSVQITANDNAGNKTIFPSASTYYSAKIDTTAPVVEDFKTWIGSEEVTGTPSLTNANKANFKITATISDVNAGLAQTNGVVVVDKNTVISGASVTHTGSAYTITFPSSIHESVFTTGTHEFGVRVTDGATNITTKTKAVSIDVTAPTVKISGLRSDTPTTKYNNQNVVNGKVVVTGTAVDETELGTTGAVSWTLTKSGSSSPAKSGTLALEGGISAAWELLIDTTQLDDATYTLSVKAKDAAANESTASTYSLVVVQASDYPVITIGGGVLTTKTEIDSDVKAKNLFSTAGMTLTVSDDDELDTVVVAYRAHGSSDAFVPLKTETADKDTSLNFTADVHGLAVGEYDIRITAKDKKSDITANGETVTQAAVSKYTPSDSGYFVIIVDTDTPYVTADDSGAFRKENAPITISGKVSDSTGIVTIVRADDKTGITNPVAVATITDCTSQTSWSDTLTTGSTTKTYYYVATDKYGRTNFIDYKYVIDNKAPTFASGWSDENATMIAGMEGKTVDGVKYVNKNTFTFRIPVSDSWVNNAVLDDVSGIASVTMNVTNGGTTTEAAMSKTEAYAYTYSGTTYGEVYHYYSVTHTFQDGQNSVSITAKDKAGNDVTYGTTYTFNVDVTSPALTVLPESVADYLKAKQTFTGTASDGNFDRLEVTYKVTTTSVVSNRAKNATAETTAPITVNSDNSWSWTMPTDGNYASLKFTAYDKAGNKSISDTYITTVDIQQPELKLLETTTDWRNSTTQNLKIYAGDWGTGSSYSSGIASVSYSDGSARTGDMSQGGLRDANGKSEKETGHGNLLYYEYSSTFDGLSDGTTTFTITATDAAGNTPVQKTATYNIDTQAPAVTSTIGSGSAQYQRKKEDSSTAYEIRVAPNDTNTSDNSLPVSGIKSVSVKKNGNLVSIYESSELTGGNYSKEFSVEAGTKTLTDGYKSIWISSTEVTEGTNIFTIYVKDYAGNEGSSEVYFYYDKSAPVVAYTSHAAGAVVNKTITVSGTVQKNTIISTPLEYASGITQSSAKVQWSTDGTSWTDLAAGTDYTAISIDDTKWTLTGLDTTKLNSSATAADRYVRIYVEDTYNNVSSENLKLSVDQNADRPVIELSTISALNDVIPLKKVSGTISDDDGITSLKLWYIESSAWNGTAVPTTSSDNGWTKITVNGSGTWTVSNLSDESHSWLFYVIDANGGTFWTHSTDSTNLTVPYLTVNNVKDNNTAPLPFKVDTVAPKITMYVSNEALAADSDKWQSAGTVFGGTSNKLYIKLVVQEQNMVTSEATVYALPSLKIGTKTPAVSLLSGSSITVDADATPAMYTYLLAPITLDSATYDSLKGSVTVMATLADKSAQEGQGGTNIILDYTAPEVKIITPTATISDAVIAATTVKGTVTDDYSAIKKLEYAIPLSGVSYTESSENWSSILASSAAWELAFTSGSTESPDSLLYYVNDMNVAATKYSVSEIEDGLGIYKVPVYFRVTDSVGNIAVDKSQFVYADPNGGKPKAWINAPEEGSVTSGTVTIYGGASDNISVSKVCVQIDANGDGAITEADYTAIAAASDSFIGDYASGMLVASTSAGANDWYILAGGTNSWKCPIITDAIGNYSGSETTIGTVAVSETTTVGNTTKNNKYLVARVRAIDGDGLSREYTSYHCIVIDNTAPWFTDMAVVQYGSGVTPTASSSPITEREYISGMYISNNSVAANGSWYLTGYVNSSTDISSISRTVLESQTAVVVELPEVSTTSNVAKISSTQYKILIPLATSSSGMIYAELKSENGAGTGNQAVKINIDSTAPSLYTTTGAETQDASTSENLRLKSQSKVLGTDLSSNSVIENSDGYFTFGDNVIEAGSGLSFIAFYMQNEVSAKVYDPLSSNSGTAISGSKTANALYINGDGLAAFYVTGATRSTPYSLTHAGIDSARVRVGGLVKIGGSYHTIASVEGTTVTFSPASSTAFTEAELIYAQVVDHQITEYFDTVYDENDDASTALMNDDGDKMCETITQIGSTYQWTASVNSTNLPDGKTYICVVAMDNAGNLSVGKIKSIVANNRPRMTKVFLGTDLNSSGRYDFDADEAPVVSTSSKYRTVSGTCYGEFSYYTAYNTRSGEGQSVVSLGSSSFKVVNGLCVLPEFVGGNGSLKYNFAVNDTTTTPNSQNELSAMISRTELLNSYVNVKTGSIDLYGTVSETDADGNTNSIAYSGTDNGGITYYDYGGIVVAQNTLSSASSVKLTFWDETDGAQSTMKSQWATLVIPFTNMAAETNPPEPKIIPFYWKGAKSNSVYISSAIAGHIELEGADLPTNSAYTSGLPKVSGKIKVEGEITDDVLINSISMNVFGNSGTVSTYSNGVWTEGSLPTGVVSFTATDEDLSQNGHTVSYVAVIDTEKLSGVVGLNKVITISATDWKSNTSTPGSTQTASGANTAYYAMDVVPYVTEVVTHLSPFYKQAPSVYARTALGHYPVYEGETIQFVGYNLGTNVAKVTVNGMSATALSSGTVGGTTVNNTIKLDTNTDSATGAKSGAITLTVADSSSKVIPAVNNLNSNDAKGGYTGSASDDGYANAYNRQPNGVNNNTLTDDLELDVWQFKNAAEPVSGGASYVTMKINPKTGVPGFSYANSILYFNMPGYDSNQNKDNWGVISETGGTVYSQIPFGMNYGGFSHNSFAFDKNGYSYGAAMCTDTSTANESAFFQFFSREAPLPISHMGQNMNYANTWNASRLDCSSVPVKGDDSGWITDIDRIQSISMDTSVNGSTYVFMAYYDQPLKQVRFRWGTVSSSGTNSFSGNGLNDVVSSSYTGVAQAREYDTNCRPQNVADSYIKYSYNQNSGLPIQVVAASGVSGARGAYSSAVNGGAGKYVSLSIVNKDDSTKTPVAIVTWYDAVNMELKMAYNVAPTTSNSWTVRTIDETGGINVKTAVDGNGGIHFAYYDNINGSDLKYAYLDSYNSLSEPTIVTVDSFSAVGAKCTIDVAKDSNDNWVPYIGYQLSSYLGTPLGAKVAYRTDFTKTEPGDGATNDMYTGQWECSIVPTQSIPNDDQINVGVYRNSSGVAQAFTSNSYWSTGDTAPGQTITNSTLNVGNPTILHGNNTANPILGYGIDTGAIEMAQKK